MWMNSIYTSPNGLPHDAFGAQVYAIYLHQLFGVDMGVSSQKECTKATPGSWALDE